MLCRARRCWACWLGSHSCLLTALNARVLADAAATGEQPALSEVVAALLSPCKLT